MVEDGRRAREGEGSAQGKFATFRVSSARLTSHTLPQVVNPDEGTSSSSSSSCRPSVEVRRLPSPLAFAR